MPVIQSDMGFSDTQMGFLGGPAFAIFYIIAGFPIGWLADRMSRRWLVGIGQFFWSLASIGFGLSQNFFQMAAARIGVGVGEASLSPSAYSIIADLFPPRRLGFALSVYGMGISVGGGLAYLVGGLALEALGITTDPTVEMGTRILPLVGEVKNWQTVFFVIALPTIPLTALLLTFREPVRHGVRTVTRADGSHAVQAVPLRTVLQYMRSNSGTIAMHNVGFACLSFSGYGATFWNPALFSRVYGWELSEFGISVGWVYILVGPLGILSAGWFADWLSERGHGDAKIRLALITSIVWIPFGVLYPIMPDGDSAFLMLIPATFFGSTYWGIAPAAIQEIMPNQMRGQASAVYLFVVNLVGLTLGPQVLALLTDYVFKDPMKVHYSLVSVGLVAHLIAAVLLFLCLRRYRESRAYLEQWQAKQSDAAESTVATA